MSGDNYVTKLKDLQKKWDNPALLENSPTLDWRANISSAVKNQDIHALKQNAIVGAQYQMIQLANEAESEAIRFQAAQFLLSQNGHGPVSKVEHSLDYKRLPASQLRTIIQSKLMLLKKRRPEFDLNALLPPPESADVARETKDIEMDLVAE